MDSQNMDNEEWNFLFGKQDSRQSPFRSVEVRAAQFPHNEESIVSMENPTYHKTNTTVSTRKESQLSEESTDHLVRFVMLAAGVDLNIVFAFLEEYVQTHQKNFKITGESFSFISYVFDGTHFAQFRVSIFSNGQDMGVCLHVLEGAAQDAVTEFWRKLKLALIGCQFVDQPEEDLSVDMPNQCEDDDDFFDSWYSDEEDILSLAMPTAPSLPISAITEPTILQPGYVNNLMEDLQDQNFMMHSILLLAFNCQLQQNLEIISKAGQAQQLFDSIIACLVASAADFCLPVVRSASLLVNQLVETGAITISEDQLQVLVNTVAQWTIQNHTGNSETVTQSEEIAQLLTSQLPKLAHVTSNIQVRKTLEEVYSQVPYKSVRQNIKPLVESF